MFPTFDQHNIIIIHIWKKNVERKKEKADQKVNTWVTQWPQKEQRQSTMTMTMAMTFESSNACGLEFVYDIAADNNQICKSVWYNRFVAESCIIGDY